jgi:hypothetical protein
MICYRVTSHIYLLEIPLLFSRKLLIRMTRLVLTISKLVVSFDILLEYTNHFEHTEHSIHKLANPAFQASAT